jgi:hypothetical protein
MHEKEANAKLDKGTSLYMYSNLSVLSLPNSGNVKQPLIPKSFAVGTKSTSFDVVCRTCTRAYRRCPNCCKVGVTMDGKLPSERLKGSCGNFYSARTITDLRRNVSLQPRDNH